MATYEELMQSAEQIRTNELPESNTHQLVGQHLKNQVEHFNKEGNGIKSLIEANKKEVDGKLAELGILTGELESIDYGVKTPGVIDSIGKIKTDGWAVNYRYSSMISVKKGDTIIVGNTSTPSYCALAKYNGDDENYTPLVVGNSSKIYYIVTEDMDVVFSGNLEGDRFSSYILESSLFDLAIKSESSKIGARVEELNSAVKRNKNLFLGYVFNEDLTYSYTRIINIDNFELVKGSSFIVTMKYQLYSGSSDADMDPISGQEVKFNVNNTGLVDVYYNGKKASSFNTWKDNETLKVYYDGEKFIASSLYGIDIDTLKWFYLQNIVYENLYYEGIETGNYIQYYDYFIASVKKNDFLYIETDSTSSIPLISKVEEDGGFTTLLDGSSKKNLYRVKEDMNVRIIYRNSKIPIAYKINSKLTEILTDIDINISQLQSEIAKKASIADLNTKASVSDIEAEKRNREEADKLLEEKINNIGDAFEGDIAEVVRQWLEENPDATTTVADGSINEAKLSATLKAKVSYSYSTLADMKADTTLDVGMTAITKGYWTLNDGGGGIYNIVESGKENGGDIIKLNNGKYAELVYDKRTFRLKQWGIDGKTTIKRAKDIYPFLSNEDLTAVNPLFDSETTAETYMIQYLLDKKLYVNGRIILDGAAYYINHTIYPSSFATIEGLNEASRNTWIQQVQLPQYLEGSPVHSYSKSLMIMIKAGIPMFGSKKFIDPNEDDSKFDTVQLFKLKNFNASGTFAKKGGYDETPGDFWNSTNLVMSRCEFENIGVSSFKNGFYVVEECDWCIWDKVYVRNMRDNGLFLPVNGTIPIIGSGQKNANLILNCEIVAIGRDCNSEGVIINKYEATYDDDGNPNVLPISKPDINRGNAIVIGNSGNVIQNCDVSGAAVGVYRCSYSEGTVCSGLYSEEISLAQVYDDYTDENPNSVIVGGYMRSDRWKDSTGQIHNNIKHAKKGDFN